MMGSPTPSLIKSTVTGVTFDRVLLNGVPVAAEVNVPVKVGSLNLAGAQYKQ